jgi:hypothetical protein
MEDGSEITVVEAARIIGVGPRQVRWYYSHGLLIGRRIGERVLVFRRADVEAFVKPKKTGRPKAKKGRGKVNGKANGK